MKYRVWDEVDKKYSNYMFMLSCTGKLYIQGTDDITFPANARFRYELSTGLKDKNGVEIYEGDILKLSPHSEYLRFVKWAGEWKLYPLSEGEAVPLGCVSTSHPDAIVVGNINESLRRLYE